MRRSSALVLALALSGCHGAGPYGHAPRYVMLAGEGDAVAGAREYDPVMVARLPDDWKGKGVMLFGIVTARGERGSDAYLALSLRSLEPRNLCENAADDDTCSVTVSDREFATVHAVAKLRPQDDDGPDAVRPGSLVRLVGELGDDVDPGDGAAVLRVTWYRHWPLHTYVTRASANVLRQ